MNKEHTRNKMFRNIICTFLFVTSVQAQLNGEFWWLNSKLNSLKNVKPSLPNIDVSDFQNDESRIVFRDDDLFTNKVLKPIKDRTSKFMITENSSENKIVWPKEEHTKNQDDLFISTVLKPIKDRTSKLMVNESSDENKIVWPKEKHMKNHDVEVFTNKNSGNDNSNETKPIKVQNKLDEHIKNHNVEVLAINNIEKENSKETKPVKIQNKFKDVLIFSYPKNDKYVTVEPNKAISESVHLTTQNAVKETQREIPITETLFNADILPTATSKDKKSQNICTYTKKSKCNDFHGFVYEYARRVPMSTSAEPLVCCILPIQPILSDNNLSQTMHFARNNNLNRRKRSNVGKNIALDQRDFLLKRKFSTQLNVNPSSTVPPKIVTPPEDDYVDPYWNVKNTKFQNSDKPNTESTRYDYYSEDYGQEYTDELPKPGLYGLYSDHAKSPSSWSFASGNKGFSYGGSDADYEENEDDDDENFGYSTIDPRQGLKKQKPKGEPSKLTTISDEVIYDAESHTINFQSNPDFHVFQGFKLLNLFRNTSRVYTKNSKKPQNEVTNKDILVAEPSDSEETGEIFDEDQLFDNCGRTMAKKANDKGNSVGEAASGSHPWMALVVLTKRKHNVLCYATLVHPRAAVTVADCVHGTAPGDITVIAGLWDMTDRSRSRLRVATVHVHPRYKPGDVENNLAVLDSEEHLFNFINVEPRSQKVNNRKRLFTSHWMRPLKLTTSVQPACLGTPQIGDECKFFGWGGLDQGIQQQRSQWQRVTVRACSGRLATKKRTRSSTEPFCVTVPRGTVTGMGGSLICEIESRSSIVGAVVSRDGGYVLFPVRDWVMKAQTLVNGD